MSGLGIFKNTLVFQSFDGADGAIALEFYDIDTGALLQTTQIATDYGAWNIQRIGGNNARYMYGLYTDINFYYKISSGAEIDVFAVWDGSYHVDIDSEDRILYCAKHGMIASSSGEPMGSLTPSGIVVETGASRGQYYEAEGIAGIGRDIVVGGGCHLSGPIEGSILDARCALTRYSQEEGAWVVKNELYFPTSKITCIRTDRASIVALLGEDDRIQPAAV
jgi:hypothetical protein